MNRIGIFPLQDTAVSFYRLIQPAEELMRQKKIGTLSMLPFSGENSNQRVTWTDRSWMDVAEGADVIWGTFVSDPEDILKLLNIRKWSGARLIIDMDDNFYAIPKDNPAHAQVGQLQKYWETCLAIADGITVSVPTLKTVYQHLNPNIYVQKNCLDFTYWDTLENKPNRRGKIRIGWRGALGHKDDLFLVLPAIRELAKVHDIELVTFGYKPDYPSEHHDWVPFRDYPEFLSTLRLDIAIVPLVDSAYNRCKSNLNWLENSALKIPVVYSPVENQKGLPGMVATNNFEWYDCLERLITDRDVRRRLGESQYRYVKTNFNIKDSVDGLVSWMDDLPYRTDLEP